MVNTSVEPQLQNLQPNIQDLQPDVIDLLKEISALMTRAKNNLSNDNNSNKYRDFCNEVNQAISNVENLELRMAIVAPMKAGKSTIINAIVGQDLLPSRNAAMTTIPTKIFFDAAREKPVLVLNEEIYAVFADTWNSLQKQINSWSNEVIDEKIAQYPHLIDLAKKIKNDRFYIPQETTGRDNISLVLTQLNDIVRLCSTLDPIKDPLAMLVDVPCIETPFMTSEQVKKFVFSDLNLSESSDSDRIFEISARQAFSATKFLWELQQNPGRDIAEMKTLEALAQEVLGNSWSRKLQRTTIEELQEEAEYLWSDSGFKPFLEQAIKALMESAAPKCMLSALTRCRSLLLALKDDLHLRSQAIFQDAEKLQEEIDALEVDLKHLELCRTLLAEVKNIKKGLQGNLSKELKQLKKDAQVRIEDYFVNKDYERGNLLTKAEIKGFELFSTWISRRFKQ